jgi:cell volume regulation protein A
LAAGSVAALAFDVPWSTGFLIGAALAPTDPAILIPLLERLRLRPKVAQTVIAESALNDATGAALALVFAGVVLTGSASLAEPVEEFAADVGIATGLGIGFGIALSLLVSSHRAGIWRETSALVVLAVVAAGFVSIDYSGGSGYLGAFIAGLIVGNMDRLRLAMHSHHERDMRVLVATVADVAIIFVFVTLGVNLPWSDIADEIWPALAVVGALVLVARPLTVLACLIPDRRGRWSRRELAFVAWTRETGVVAAAVAALLVGMHVPRAELVVTTVAVAIIVTLTVQATTKRWLARRLGLLGD